MVKIENIKETETQLLNEMKACIAKIRALVDQDISSIADGVTTLRRVRQEVY